MLDRFLNVFDSLEKEKVDYVLIGGLAVVLHGLPRFTHDIDIFIKESTENISRLKKALYRIYDDKNIEEITAEELDRYAVIRYAAADGLSIDIISKIGEVFSYKDLEFEIMNVKGHTLRVATPATLFMLKKNTVRPIDKEDVQFLKQLIKEKGE